MRRAMIVNNFHSTEWTVALPRAIRLPVLIDGFNLMLPAQSHKKESRQRQRCP